MSEERKIDVIEKATAFDGYYRIDRYRLKHSLHKGGMGDEISREVFERGHVGAVLPVDPDRDRVVLIEQFRPGAYAAGWEPWLLECVAGVIEEGENPEELAHREAMEEAGCEVSGLRQIHRYLTTPGACSETVTLFVGRVDSSVVGGIHGLEEEGEDIRVHIFSVEEAIRMMQDGRIVNAKTIIALQWLALNYEALKKDWSARA